MSSRQVGEQSSMHRKKKVYMLIIISFFSVILYSVLHRSKLEYVDTSVVIRNSPTFTQNVTSANIYSELCSKKQYDVAFLKVHKAGSSTIQNIFLRFAIGNNLNIVLPKNSTGYGFNYLGYGTSVNKSRIVPLPDNEKYNILCNHVVYNKEAFDSVMPSGSMYVGIVREPKSHFISASIYYGLYKTLRKYYRATNETTGHILSRFLNEFTALKKFPLYYVNNRMSFDFGLPPKYFRDSKFVKEFIKKLDSEFKLVMLMEKFDESLVLMKRRLCWDLKDILYIPLNVNRGKLKQPIVIENSAERNLYYFDYADFHLYNHFSKRFYTEVAAEGPGFAEEVKHFKHLKDKVTAFCFGYNKSDIEVPESKWNPPFTVSWEDCIEMKMPELKMVRTLITEANARYHDWYLHEKLKLRKIT